ncbi:MAG: ABC transporter substrate-binding protein [Elusimicrobia bacterium]|nr:ABC transporter substrate-binding protein [Elusimicrobiota bacterium]
MKIRTALIRKVLPAGILIVSGFISINAGAPAAGKELKPGQPVKIGYFHGGRTALMLRLYEDGGFEKKGLKVDYYTKTLRGSEYKIVPRSIAEFNTGGTENIGKAKGTELIDAVLEGKFDLAMTGESSFIYSVYAGKPVVAIAELGHDVRGQAGHVFVMRKGLKTERPQDYFGKVLVSRRAGPGDAIFLREYLEYSGVDLSSSVLHLDALPKTPEEKARLPKNKVIVVEDVYEDDMRTGLKNGVIDGGYFHLMGVPKMTRDFNIIKSLNDFADPELSHALLVCTRDFLNANRETLTALLEAYIGRIKYEHGLSYEERTRPQDKGLQIAINFHGLNYPQYDLIPSVSPVLLYEVDRLLRKYGFIEGKKAGIEEHIDNSLVFAALKRLNLTEKDDLQPSKY